MKRAGVVLALLACSKHDDKPKAEPVAAQPQAIAVDAAPRAVRRDPRIAELFKAGTACTWNDQGLTSCDAGTKLEKLAFENQNDQELAASCAAALRDPEPTTRGLAAVCMGHFNDSARIPFLGQGLDAFEAEKDPKIAHAIAWGFSRGNAHESGVEDRVIALVKKLDAAKDDDAAANFLDTMFPQYLMQSTRPPSKAAGDLALALARKAGRHTQTRALEDIGLLTDRKPDVCAATTDALATELWPAAVETMTKFPADCQAQLPAAIDKVLAAMAAGTYEDAMRLVVKRLTLTKDQLAKLAAGTKKLLAKVPAWQKDRVKELAKLIAEYEPPTP
jgi:hypothetical protein